MKRIVGGLVLVAAMLVAVSAMSDAPRTPVAKASSCSFGSCGPCPQCPMPCPDACEAGESAAADDGASAS
jgi:hypothetical protein